MKKLVLFAVAVLAFAACKPATDRPVQTKEFAYEEYYALQEGLTDSLHISIALDFPVATQNAAVLPKIEQTLKREIFGDAYQEMPLEQAMQAYTAMLKTEYRQNNLPVLTSMDDENRNLEPEMTFSEEQIITSTVMDVHNSILSYAVERYVYMGGVHGSNYRIFYNFDLNTGKLIHEQDLFRKGYNEPLTDLLLKNLVEQNEDLSLIEDLQEYGYNVDEIHPNDNFFLTDSCMVYVFNPYDIAPYALGETEIAIRYSQLGELLGEAYSLGE